MVVHVQAQDVHRGREELHQAGGDQLGDAVRPAAAHAELFLHLAIKNKIMFLSYNKERNRHTTVLFHSIRCVNERTNVVYITNGNVV